MFRDWLSRLPFFQNLSPLERLQRKMLMYLYAGLTPEHIKDLLLADEKLQDYHDYINSMDIDMLAVGSDLVRKWGNYVKSLSAESKIKNLS